jgi:hypothetical protein
MEGQLTCGIARLNSNLSEAPKSGGLNLSSGLSASEIGEDILSHKILRRKLMAVFLV